MHELDESRVFMYEMHGGRTSDSYRINSGGEIVRRRTYAGAPPLVRICPNDCSTREVCHFADRDCERCISEDEMFEMRQYDLDQALRESRNW